mgnify:CR=1 FL=1
MTKDPKPEVPKVELATQDWTLKEITDVERRIEKAFHEQTQFLSAKLDQRNDSISQKMDNNIKWMVGLVVTMTVAIIVAVLFQG